MYSLNFPLLSGPAEWNEVGLDAKGVVVVSLDPAEPGSATTFLTTPPAPPVGDPMHYDAFIQTLCSRFTERFG